MINKNLIIYLSILIFGLVAPFIFPAFKVQLSILCVLIILAITWNIQGGEMGYNSFGNILFYGLGMYLCASVQVGMFFPLAEWTESGGEKTFVHTPAQFFQGFGVGLAVAAVVPTIVAGLIGYSILGLRGHYFAIGLVIYMKKSKLGRAIRATAQNARAAKILGVDTEKVYAATFGINAALCGVAGALISITFTIHPYMGLPYTIRSFMIVIVAGLGNLPGVAISGMGLGVFEEFADYILGTEFRIGSVFLLLVLILVYRRFKLAKKREYLK